MVSFFYIYSLYIPFLWITRHLSKIYGVLLRKEGQAVLQPILSYR